MADHRRTGGVGSAAEARDEAGRDAVRAWSSHLGHDVDDAAAQRRRLRAGSVPAASVEQARRAGHRPALSVGAVALTHGQLDDRSRRVAAALAEHGVAAGDRVLLAGPTSPAYVCAYLGVLHRGAAVVSAGAMLTDRELGALAAAASPAAAMAAGPRVDQLRAVWAAGGDPPVLDLEAVAGRDAPSAPLPPRPPDPDEVAHLSFTSGTTGAPKATPLRHGNVLASARAVMAAWRWRPDDVLVHALPLQHGHGLSGVHTTLLAGSALVVLPDFDPEHLCRTIAEQRATVLFAVPTMYRALVEWSGFGDADLSSLRLATTGSAAMPPELSDAVTEVLGHRPLERYGTTECGYVLSNPHDGPRLVGRVGTPLPGAEVVIVDQGGRPVASGEEGEIVVRGPQVFSGYADAAITDAFLDGGWFRTGDLGRSDTAGSVAVTGRRKELIITGGMNVHPREVEEAIETRPEILEAAVAGLPSRRWGEEVTAFVVLRPGAQLDRDGLAEALRRSLAAYKRPKAVHVVARLPRNHLGKLLRTRLPDLLEPGVDADPAGS